MMITAQNVSKVYVQGDTSVRAVNQVSLGIQPGEFVVIMGKSGSGKSTLLHIIAIRKHKVILFRNWDTT